MIYQMIIKALKELQETGTDIGSAVKYCNDNIFDLVNQYETMSVAVPDLVGICLANK